MTLPTVMVEVAFGGTGNSTYFQFDDSSRGLFNTGTFGPSQTFTDVSSLTRAVSTVRGKQRTLDAYRPAAIAVALSNNSGDFDPNNLSGAYVSGGVTAVLPMVPVRVRASFLGTVYDVAYGYADSWDVTYPGHTDAVTTLQATDGFKVIAATVPPSLASPTFVSASTTSANASSVTVTKPAGVATGDVMIALIVQGTGTAPAAVTPSGWTALLTSKGYPGLQSYTRTVQAGEVASYTWANDPQDGTSYHWNASIVAYTGSSGVIASSEISGGPGTSPTAQSVSTSVDHTTNVFAVANAITLAGPTITGYTVVFTPDYTGRVAQAISGASTLSVAEVTQDLSGPAHINPPSAQIESPAYCDTQYFVLGPAPVGAGEDTGARINRLLNSVGWSATDRAIDTGFSTLQGTTFAADAMSEIQSVVLTELGDFFMAKDGKATFLNRGRRNVVAGSSLFNQFVDDNYQDVVVAFDDELLVNSASGSNTGGRTQTATDATSVAKYLTKSYSQSGLWNTEDTATRHWAEWIVHLNKNPELRVETLKFQLGSDDTLTALLLGAELGDYFEITRTPPMGDVIQRFVFLIGLSWDIKPNNWQVTCAFASADGYAGSIVFDRVDPNVGFNNSAFTFSY